MKIMTKRLLLRPFTEEDAKDWYYMTQDNSICRYLPYTFPVTIHQALADIQEYYINCDFINDFYFLIDERSLKKPIGAIIITKSFDSNVYEVAFLIDKKYRRQGYMEEALKGLLKKWPKNKTLIFEVSTDNYASTKLISKFKNIHLSLASPEHQVYTFTK